MALALQALTPSPDDKAVSATTKKRLAIRSVQGLKQSQVGVQALVEHLKALQAASQTWQRSMMYASKSHQELMEQIESTTQELGSMSERLRSVEAQRIAAVRDAETLRARVTHLEALAADLQAGLKQKEEELDTVQFTAHESQADASRAVQQEEKLRQAVAQAEERAQAAVAALDDAKAEAAKAHTLAERHQQVVAKLTADNLMFLMQLKKAEADLATANQERAQLRLAAEQQRGPWFDQVRVGVEERVKQAMQRSVELEAKMERQAAEHAQQLAELEQRRQDLAAELVAVRGQADDLQHRLSSAEEGQTSADKRCAAAESAAAELRQRLEDLSAENRVLQESVKAMRQECTERWVREQAALGRVGGLEERIAALEAALSQQAAAAASLQRQLDTQVGVNRQLMARKEEVEWQLMAAMAKVDGGAADGPVPLNLLVSGMLQVGGGQQQAQQQQAPPQQAQEQAQRAGTPAAGPAPQATQHPAPAPSAPHFEHAGASAGSKAAQPAAAAAVAAAEGSAVQLQQPLQQRSHNPEAGANWHGSAAPPAAIPSATVAAAPPSAPTPITPSTAFAAAAAHRTAPAEAPAKQAAAQQPVADAATAAPASHATHPAAAEAATANSGARGHGAPCLLQPEPTLALHDNEFDMFSLAPAARRTLAASAGTSGSAGVGAGPAVSTSGTAPWQQPSGAPGQRATAGLRSVSGLSTGAGGATDTNARWASVDAASTVLSSPPSSVAISTEPGSPPAEVVPYRPPAPSAQAPPARAPLTIRTGPLSAAAGGSAKALGSEGAQPQPVAVAALQRQGSLHDGGDIWVGDAASPTSSDSSDFFGAAGGGGIIVQHTTHGAPGGAGISAVAAAAGPRGSDDGDRAGLSASRAVLAQLQEQLQIHLIAPSAARNETAAAAAHSAAAAAQAAAAAKAAAAALDDDWRPRGPATAAPAEWTRPAQARAPATASASDADADFIRSRPTITSAAGGGSSGSGITVGTRSTFSIRTTTAAPVPSASAAVPTTAAPSAAALPSMHASSDSAAGVFSIMRSSAAAASRLASTGSPKHPAFASAASSSAATPSSPQALPSSRTAATTAASAASAPAEPPVPSRVQQGPVYHATAGPLSGDAVADIKRWSAAGGSAQLTSTAATVTAKTTAAGPAQASATGVHAGPAPPQQPQQQQVLPRQAEQVPPHSPAYSRDSLSSPRSPPHPAFVVRPTAPPAAATGGVGASYVSAAASYGAGYAGSAAALPASATAAAITAATGNGAPTEPGSGAFRPRVSFQGLAPHAEGDVSDVARGASGGGISTQASFTSVQSTPLSHRSGSAKSVRFTDDGDAADGGFSERRGQDSVSTRGYPSVSARQPAAALRASPPPYKSQGPVQHPALVITSPAKSIEAATREPTGGATGPDASAPAPKRYSAAGVAVTAALPRVAPAHGQSQ
ncbi:hypothetical protein HYH02_000005 [Chlamydomonas schloesseri]|uniref:Uncharacterized protein n=1 Tax=Chlamydomonas schloesseri TaxID=2026947 RepID=A0A835WME9_9CHLO|nr:hypothetical protein HYH02_000005 [Chlamydomonas schloesseri]|eukprot:KAG2449899.1 hypothetical protein HYH02_000005 [Chlamydomonas schloesseri]